jgi:hypothetical protein
LESRGLGQPGAERHGLEHRERGAVPSRLDARSGMPQILARATEVAAPRAERAATETAGLVSGVELEQPRERGLGAGEIAEALARDREREPQTVPRSAADARAVFLQQRFEPSLGVVERSGAQRLERRADGFVVLALERGRIEIGQKARALGDERGEPGEVSVPGLEHGREVLELAVDLFEPRLAQRQRFAAVRAARRFRAGWNGSRALAALAPPVAVLTGEAEPCAHLAVIAAQQPACGPSSGHEATKRGLGIRPVPARSLLGVTSESCP